MRLFIYYSVHITENKMFALVPFDLGTRVLEFCKILSIKWWKNEKEIRDLLMRAESYERCIIEKKTIL